MTKRIGRQMIAKLLSLIKKKISEVYLVGEAEQPGNVGSALRSAAKVALEI